MLKALYYPYTDIKSPLILKNALLLWDSLETIVPWPNWKTARVDGNRGINEAVDLLVRPRVPTEAERRQAHSTLDTVERSGLLPQLVQASPPEWRHQKYYVYSQKFLQQTWRMLANRGVAKWMGGKGEYSVPPAIGMLMMSLLADACAGTEVHRITDRREAYKWLSDMNARLIGSQNITGFSATQIAPNYDRLVTLSLEVLDARNIPLKKLIAFRKRESRWGGADYSAMRRRYLNALQAHLKRVGSEARSPGDIRELEDQFKKEIRADVEDLKSELQLASGKALLSKEVFLSTLLTAGAFVAPEKGWPELAKLGYAGVIPLLKSFVEYRGARRAALQRHLSSWLFLADKKGLRLW